MKQKEYLIIENGVADKQYWINLWKFRELFYVLAWRDIAVRYKQTVLGILWALMRPFLTMVVFTVIFGKIAKLDSDSQVPYSLMVFAGLLPWQFFSSALSDSSNSIVGNTNLINKVFFPRLIIPVSSIIVTFVDFFVSFSILIVMMIWYSFLPSWHILFLPIFILMVFAASLGPGLLLTTLNVKYRDFRYVIPFIVQIGLYISPVGFGATAIPEKWQLIYSLNPMVGIINAFRWSILGGDLLNIYQSLITSLIIIVFFLWIGISHFRKMEKSFADLI